MKKVLFSIFAHPDDEAFGPSATLLRESTNGTDIHLILITDGENGINTDNYEDLGSTRLKEWRASGKLLGIRSGIALHYPDGGLSNNLYLEIADKIQQHIQNTLSTYTEPVSVEFMTFDSEGITGHLDHIAVSYITTYVYLKLKEQDVPDVEVNTLRYYCLPDTMIKQVDTSWIYQPCGKEKTEIDECTDYSDIADKKLEIMQAHYSQRSDMEKILSYQDKTNPDCLCDHFRYFK